MPIVGAPRAELAAGGQHEAGGREHDAQPARGSEVRIELEGCRAARAVERFAVRFGQARRERQVGPAEARMQCHTPKIVQLLVAGGERLILARGCGRRGLGVDTRVARWGFAGGFLRVRPGRERCGQNARVRARLHGTGVRRASVRVAAREPKEDRRGGDAKSSERTERAHQRAEPMSDLTVTFPRSQCARRPSSTRLAAEGSAKLAVPTCTAVAPASKNSSASRVVETPPMAMTGIETAPATSQTMRSAMGRNAGPLKPPVRLASRSLFCSTSIDMPRIVLMAVMAS